MFYFHGQLKARKGQIGAGQTERTDGWKECDATEDKFPDECPDKCHRGQMSRHDPSVVWQPLYSTNFRLLPKFPFQMLGWSRSLVFQGKDLQSGLSRRWGRWKGGRGWEGRCGEWIFQLESCQPIVIYEVMIGWGGFLWFYDREWLWDRYWTFVWHSRKHY